VPESLQAVYFEACIGAMFGPTAPYSGVAAAFRQLAARAGITLLSPPSIGSLCCGTPWKSKGLSAGYRTMAESVLPALWQASAGGRLPVVVDASSCSEGLHQLLELGGDAFSALAVLDSVTFADTHLLPRLTIQRRLPSLALHPTCSSTRLGINDALRRVAGAIADTVVVPHDWGCCAFAGDRGMLHPELTAAATAPQAAELDGVAFTAYASTNRTCELGLTRATGRPYRHILELLEHASS